MVETLEIAGRAVEVREIRARDMFEVLEQVAGGGRWEQAVGIVQRSAFGADGAPAFTVEELAVLPWGEFSRLNRAVQRVNGIDEEAAEKN